MRKIVIFGSYNGSSIGDTALLLGLISSIKRVEHDCQIVVMTAKYIGLEQELDSLYSDNLNNVQEVCVFANKSKWNPLRLYQKLLKKNAISKNKVRRALKNADHLIIGGGNLIMDLYPQWPLILKEIINEANSCNIRYSLVGIGAGPITTPLGIKFFSEILNEAYKVCFRDSASLKYCYDTLSFKDGIVGPDCVFGIDWQAPATTSPNKTLLLNLAAVFSSQWPYQSEPKFNLYVSSVYSSVKAIMNSRNLDKLVIYNTNYPIDEEAVLELLKLLKKADFEVEYIKGKLQVSELLHICSNSNLAIITRLHAGLIAYIAKCEIMAISYQPKVKDVLSSVGVMENIIDIESFIQGKEMFRTEGYTHSYVSPDLLRIELDNMISAVINPIDR